MSRIVETIWRSVLWREVDEENVYMKILYYVTKPQLFKMKF
jgi:hypothetical protein